MPRPSRLKLAKADIAAFFAAQPPRAYSKTELAAIFHATRRDWNLARSTTPPDFIAFLVKQGILQTWDFRSKAYANQGVERFVFGEVSPLALAISLKSRGYLCHGTAMALHGIGKANSKELYLNVEQSAKPSRASALSQVSIKQAFSRKQRRSNLVLTSRGVSVIIVSGKNTGDLGVEETKGSFSEALRVTSLARTLIDIVVRPAYAGGAREVLKAYQAAKGKVSPEELASLLKRIDYVYPYHQAIGFLMEYAGYAADAYERFRARKLKHDFYLAHGMLSPKYSKDWRLYYPADFK